MTEIKLENLPPEEIKNIQDYRIVLLDKNYERLADKVDAGFREVRESISSLRNELKADTDNIKLEMHNLVNSTLWKIPLLIVAMSTAWGVVKSFAIPLFN
ncbi:guanylate kinase [Candidatus Liberibacter solanacearum]|uniref:Guanylate kinase n=1 Tax=Candidatus Liberibacter solanacearum TaxID=556287 RepID=A0A424FM31_9HYPH|nr:guanylate kinase [Candidatus Liberibacter solanacearum]RPD37188.1 guanylate kinase [Candidatus Liberibacter solanacearum]